MTRVILTFVCALAVIATLAVTGPAVAQEPDAAKLFADGKALLATGDLDGAYRGFVAAVKADPANQEYSQQALLLRRVLQVKAHVAKAEPSATWERHVTSLHIWYVGNGLLEAAVDLDRAAHAKSQSPRIAALLADVLLETKRDAEAEKVLTAIPAADRASPHRLFLGIAQARQGKKDEARKQLEGLEITEAMGPGPYIVLARLHVLLGDADAGLKDLRTSFEMTPPGTLETVKADVKGCPDFASVRTTKAFAAVLATKSKVAESDCSSGSDCGSCPSRGGCGDSGGKTDGKTGGGCGESGGSSGGGGG